MRNLGLTWPMAGPPPPYDPDLYDCTIQARGSNGMAGIVGTPVIDLSSGTMYVVGNLMVSGASQHKIFAINIRSGLDATAPAVICDGPGAGAGVFDPGFALQRAGLLLADHRIVAAYASFRDIPPFQGWAFTFDRNSLTKSDQWNYSPHFSGAAIWMSGAGPSFDGQNAYVVTGNNKDDYGTGSPVLPIELSNSLLQINPFGSGVTGLGQIHQFLPPQASLWSVVGADKDLSSSRSIVLPGTNYVLASGKWGNVYVLDRTAPLSSPPSSTTTPATTDGGSLAATFSDIPGNTPAQLGWGIYGGLAYWNGRIYTWANQSPLRSYSLTNVIAKDSAAGQKEALDSMVIDALAIPISISSNSDLNGLIWAARTNGRYTSFSAGKLEVYDAVNLVKLASIDFPNSPLTLVPDSPMKFSAPVVANGRVYIATAALQLLVYGLP